MPGSACRPPTPPTPTSAGCADRPAIYPGRPPRRTGPATGPGRPLQTTGRPPVRVGCLSRPASCPRAGSAHATTMPRRAGAGCASWACPARKGQERRERHGEDGALVLFGGGAPPECGTSGVQLAGPGGINQVEIPFDGFPQFVLRVAAVATVLAPPVMIPVLVADLAQMSQRRAQVFPELQPPIGRLSGSAARCDPMCSQAA